MKEITIFESEDGKVFDSAEECLEYEKSLTLRLHLQKTLIRRLDEMNWFFDTDVCFKKEFIDIFIDTIFEHLGEVKDYVLSEE